MIRRAQQARSVTHADPALRETARVLAPPPFVYGAAWAIARLIHRRIPIRTGLPRLARRLVGWTAVCVGAGMSGAVVGAFRSAGTPVSPLDSTTALVTTGPYRFTRNPDYMGQLLVYAGAALLANTAWPFAVLPAVLATIDRGVVRREERYLRDRFGARYADYAARVPRWV